MPEQQNKNQNSPPSNHALWRSLNGLSKDPGPWTAFECLESYLQDRIEFQAWLAEDIGYMKRLKEKHPAAGEMIDDIISRQQREYWQIDIEIDRLGEAVNSAKGSH